jgi:hypothetical protein
MMGAIRAGAEMIYVAMFDEIDEGTAIFKCAKEVPTGKSTFVPIEEIEEMEKHMEGAEYKQTARNCQPETALHKHACGGYCRRTG